MRGLRTFSGIVLLRGPRRFAGVLYVCAKLSAVGWVLPAGVFYVLPPCVPTTCVRSALVQPLSSFRRRLLSFVGFPSHGFPFPTSSSAHPFPHGTHHEHPLFPSFSLVCHCFVLLPPPRAQQSAYTAHCQSEYGIDNFVSFSDGLNGLAQVRLAHPNGTTAQVRLGNMCECGMNCSFAVVGPNTCGLGMGCLPGVSVVSLVH